MSIRVLIADDEPLARQGIALRLASHADMEIVGEAGDGPDAYAKVLECKPDLIFLDIRMPDFSGLELAARLLPEQLPVIVFVTAFAEHAVAAFEREALDYLLKPIDAERFERSLHRVRRLLTERRRDDLLDRLRALTLPQPEPDGEKSLVRFSVRRGREVQFVSCESVDWIEAVGDYAALHVGKATHLVRESMHSLELKLDSCYFMRVHRSAIVQIDRIARVESLANRDFRLVLRNGTSIAGSRTYSRCIRKLLRNETK